MNYVSLTYIRLLGLDKESIWETSSLDLKYNWKFSQHGSHTIASGVESVNWQLTLTVL